MKVAIATVQVPFIRGGAEALTDGLRGALREHGHEVDVITTPFRFAHDLEIDRSMKLWEREDFTKFDVGSPDRVICLKFPTYGLAHPNKVVWLIHQHRAAYELWETPFDGGLSDTQSGRTLRDEIIKFDRDNLRRCREMFTISRRVSERLKKYNDVMSTALYHPPRLASKLHHEGNEPFIFYPSRLEDLKRQSLLIDAMAEVRSPVVAVLAGSGGQRQNLQNQIDRLNLRERVILIDHVSDDELVEYYSRCLATFFGPYDEDYGLVTLEAMLSRKPVITCHDSGEPAALVRNEETGFVTESSPSAVAEAIDKLGQSPQTARRMGLAAYDYYESLEISWNHVVGRLVDAKMPYGC